MIDTFSRDRRLIAAAIVWYLVFASISIVTFGITDPNTLITAILHPRASYYSKFDVLSSSQGSAGILQVLNLAGALYFILLPLAALHWRRLSRTLRLGVILASLAYMGFFLSTGTQKGLGDIAIALTTSLVAIAIARPPTNLGRGARWLLIFAFVAVVAIIILIVNSFGERTDSTSTLFDGTQLGRLVTELTPFLGASGARGVVVLASYATHGYLGLSYSMHLPFVWTGGLGALRGLSSYLPQYLGLPDPYFSTYPVRVESTYPWSATEVWSTVYPWLASDLSFPGVVIAMLLMGIVAAAIWSAFVTERSSLALVMIVIFAIFVVYSPANNQLFNDRYSAIGVVTLLVAYAIERVRRRNRIRRVYGPG